MPRGESGPVVFELRIAAVKAIFGVISEIQGRHESREDLGPELEQAPPQRPFEKPGVQSSQMEARMQTYTWLVMVLNHHGRYEKTLKLPFVPQVGMTSS